jgi:hypothetical protein
MYLARWVNRPLQVIPSEHLFNVGDQTAAQVTGPDHTGKAPGLGLDEHTGASFYRFHHHALDHPLGADGIVFNAVNNETVRSPL